MTILEENGRWKEEKRIEGGTKREREEEKENERRRGERDGEGREEDGVGIWGNIGGELVGFG